MSKLSPKYISMAQRREVATQWLLSGLVNMGSEMTEDLLVQVQTRAMKLARLMGKRRSFYHIATSHLDALRTQMDIEVNGVDEDCDEVAEIYFEFVGHTGSMGINPEADSASVVYDTGIEEGFSLVGSGKAYQSPAIKGCSWCDRKVNSRGMVQHDPDCEVVATASQSQTNISKWGVTVDGFEAHWLVNPKLFTPQGEYLEDATMDGGSILAFNPQEEDEMHGWRRPNGRPCPRIPEDPRDPQEGEHSYVKVIESPDSRPSIRVHMVDTDKGSQPCSTCRGTGTSYPRCTVCDAKGYLSYAMDDEVETVECPMCSGSLHGVASTMMSDPGAAGRDTTQLVQAMLRRDAEHIGMGMDMVHFWTKFDNIKTVACSVKKSIRQVKRLNDLKTMGAAQGLTQSQAEELRNLAGTTQLRETTVWQRLLLDAVANGDVDLEWMAVGYNSNMQLALNIEATEGTKLAALGRIMAWAVPGDSTSHVMPRSEEQLVGIVPEYTYLPLTEDQDAWNALDGEFGFNDKFQPKVGAMSSNESAYAGNGDSWGPYLLTREPGSAELCVYDDDRPVSSWDIYPLNPEPKSDVVRDDVRTYNPSIQKRIEAGRQAELTVLMDEVFPVIGAREVSLDQMRELGRHLREDRRPRAVTLGQFAQVNPTMNPIPLNLQNLPLSWGWSGERKVVGFKVDRNWFILNRVKAPQDHPKAGQMVLTSVRTPGFRPSDQVSCWSTHALDDKGLMANLALMGASLTKHPSLKNKVANLKNSVADAIGGADPDQGKLRALMYRVASVLFQWYPGNWKQGSKLPNLFYMRFEADGMGSNKWTTVPSYLTEKAIANERRRMCQANNWDWEVLTEQRGQWNVDHVNATDPTQAIQLNKLTDQWMQDHHVNLMTALDQLALRVGDASQGLTGLYGWWKSQRTARTQDLVSMGLDPSLKVRSYSLGSAPFMDGLWGHTEWTQNALSMDQRTSQGVFRDWSNGNPAEPGNRLKYKGAVRVSTT